MDNYNGIESLCGLIVNGKPLETFSGAALIDYSVGESALTNETFQGSNRSSWTLLKSRYGWRTIKITLIFEGENLHAAKMNRTIFNGSIFGAVELFIPGDGFWYDCVCTSLGAEELIGEGDTNAKIKATYSFNGMRRAALVSVTVPRGGAVFCRATVPFTDCRLTVTVGASAASYTFGGAVWSSVSAGDVLVFDGINKTLTKNGANAAASVSWVDFPQLVPGENQNDARDAVTVEYYPTFL